MEERWSISDEHGAMLAESEVAESLMDAFRLFAVAVGQLCDFTDFSANGHEQMTLGEYLYCFSIAQSEMKKFSDFLRCVFAKIIPGEGNIDWYRVCKTAELVIPRGFLQIAVTMAQNDFSFLRLKDVHRTILGLFHPFKGLALQQIFVKDLLMNPNVTLTKEQRINLLLDAFVFSNKLWVRLKYNSLFLDDEEAPLLDEQRKMLQEIILLPILSMSQIGDIDDYRDEILPTILQHLIACNDALAQEVISDCLLHAFPVSFHLETADLLLDAIGKFSIDLDMRTLVSEVINRILQVPDRQDAGAVADEDRLGGVFDELWIKIITLMEGRVARQLDDMVMLQVPLLHRALGMKPFQVERVERILESVHLAIASSPKETEEPEVIAKVSEKQEEETHDDLTLGPIRDPLVLIGQIVDIVLENIPSGELLLELPSLIQLFNLLQGPAATTTAMLFVERLIKDNVKIPSGRMQVISLIIDMLFMTRFDGESEWEVILQNLVMHHATAEQIFDRLIRDKDQIEMLIKSIIVHPNTCLCVLYFKKALNSYLLSDASLNEAKLLIEFYQEELLAKQVQPLLSRSHFAELSDNNLVLFLADSCPLSIIDAYCRLIERAPSDLIYDCLVECLMVYEEGIADGAAQLEALSKIISIIKDHGHSLESSALGSIYHKLYGYSRRILKAADKIDILFELLDLGVCLGDLLEDELFVDVAIAVDRLLPALESIDLDADRVIRYCRLIVNRLGSGDSSELVAIAHEKLSAIQTLASQNPIKDTYMRSAVDDLLAAWSQLNISTEISKGTSNPTKKPLRQSKSAISMVAENTKEPIGQEDKDDGGSQDNPTGEVNPFATLHPDFIKDDGF